MHTQRLLRVTDTRARMQPDSADAVREFTQRCTDVLEMYVRRHPELWLWMHRRWRDSGPTEPARELFPSASPDS